MKKVEESILIYAPMKQVFAAIAIPQNQMNFDSDMLRSCEKISDGPIGKGTRFRGDFKGMGKVEYEYSQFRENDFIEHAVKMPFGVIRHGFRFEPTTGGVRFTQSVTAEPNLLGYLVWPLMIKKMMSKRIHTLNNLLKEYAENNLSTTL